MFYAIEYAYGSTVVNNGHRADKVYEFTARARRDTWVAAGPADISASGYRAAAAARNPLVRNADYKYDGDAEAWEIIARQRVDASPALARYADTLIKYDWSMPGHFKWLATAKEAEIVSWAHDTEQAAAN